MVYILKTGGIIWLAARAHHHRTDLKLQDFILLAVVDGIGQAGLHALEAVRAVAAVQAARRFGLSLRLFIAQFNFIEVAFAFFDRQFGHTRSGNFGFVFGNRSITGVFNNAGLASHGHILSFNETQDRFGGLLAGTDRTDGNPRTGLQITAGKHAFALGGIGDGVDLSGSPAGKRQAGNILDG